MEPSPELAGIIRNWFESVSKGDGSWLDRHLSRDANLRIVGTDPQEWLQGPKARALLEQDWLSSAAT